jgi:alpha-mannosidase
VSKVSTAPAVTGTVRAENNLLENEHLRIRFSEEGTLGIFDKDNNREVFKGGQTGMRPVVLDDRSDTWSHHVVAYDEEIGSFRRQDFKVMENGPLRARVRLRSVYNTSTLTVDYILYATSRDVETRVTLDWHEHLKMLKFSFPVDLKKPQATYEVAYGAMLRGNHGDEDPGQRWIDVADITSNKPYGLSVLNDAKYGYSVDGSDMRISVVRGAVYAHHEPRVLEPGVDYNWMDQGVQNFRMLLVPHEGTWQDAGIVRSAEELNTETPIVYQGIHPGTRAQSDSFLSVNSPNIVVSAIKRSEDGDDLILRAYETSGRATHASFDLGFIKTKWSGDFHPFEIKTLRIHAASIAEVNALEQ